MRAFIVLSAILAVSLAASITPENDVEEEDVGELDDIEEAEDVVAGPTARKLNLGKSKNNDRNAELVSYKSQVEGTGYSYSYAIDDGQEREEEGHLVDTGAKTLTPEVKGSYQWTDKKTGKSIKVEYIADKDGYRAFGDSIPTPMPNPPWVDVLLRVLATAHPNEIEDEVDAKPQPNTIGTRPKTKTPIVDKHTVVRKVVVTEEPKPVEEDNELEEDDIDDDDDSDDDDDEVEEDDEE